MSRSLLSVLVLMTLLGVLFYASLSNPTTSSRASQDPLVKNRTTSSELKAAIHNDEVTITLKNNYKETITAFALGLGDAYQITEDFAYSEVHLGIAPGEVFEKSYQLPASLRSSVPTLHLFSVLLESGREEGDSRVAQKIRDERLGEKIQLLRALRVLDKRAKLPNNLKELRDDIAAVLITAESETLVTLDELQAADAVGRTKLSDDVKQGLEVGRTKMLQRCEALEQFSTDRRETAFKELKTRSSNLVTKL